MSISAMSTRSRMIAASAAIATAALGALVAAGQPASAEPVPGAQIYATGGQVSVELLASEAAAVSKLYLCQSGVPEVYLMSNGDSVGTTVDVGVFPAGTELRFCIHVTISGRTWVFYSGPATPNEDGAIHAAVDSTGPGTAIVGFEDWPGGGDQDFNDIVFGFTGVVPEEPDPIGCDSVVSDPATLTPPNNQMRPVSLVDGGGTGAVVTAISSVTQDEVLGGAPDAEAGAADNEVLLRAQRLGKGDGRVYEIGFEGTDGAGFPCEGTVTVAVPHDRSGREAVDSGQDVNSFGS